MDCDATKLAGSLVISALVLSGCMNTGARIAAPPDGNVSNCNHVFTVQFHPNFVAGSFQATMDGANWTSRFAPTPTPGGTSTAKPTGPYDGPLPHKLDIASSVNPNGSGYTLQLERRTAEFSFPQVRFFPSSFSLPRNGSASANVCLQPSPGTPVSVIIAPQATAPVQLNGNPLGMPVTLTFAVVPNPSLSCVPLTITAGTVPSTFILDATSVGCQIGRASGTVTQ